MKALAKASDDTYQWTEIDVDYCEEDLGEHDLVIQVHAAGLNRADLVQMAGHYPPPAGAVDWIGLECSGTVVRRGTSVTAWNDGDECLALVMGGACAEYVRCHQDLVVAVPKTVDLINSAGILEVYATAWLNLMMKAQLSTQDRLLIHAGASGVGLAALEIGKIFGSEVFVTAGSEKKKEYCLNAGATHAFDRGDSWAESLLSECPSGVDVILDPVGASYFPQCSSVLALDGRMVIIGLMGGAKSDIQLGRLLMKRHTLMGSTLRSLSVSYKHQILSELQERLWPLFEAGHLSLAVDSVFDIEDWHKGVARMQADQNIGKILFRIL